MYDLIIIMIKHETRLKGFPLFFIILKIWIHKRKRDIRYINCEKTALPSLCHYVVNDDSQVLKLQDDNNYDKKAKLKRTL